MTIIESQTHPNNDLYITIRKQVELDTNFQKKMSHTFAITVEFYYNQSSNS